MMVVFYMQVKTMGKIDLKATNPFGKDLDMGKLKTYWGLGIMAGVVVVFGGMVMFLKGKTGAVTGSIDDLHSRLRSS